MSPLTTILLLSALAVVLAGERRVSLLVLVAASIVLTRGQAIELGGFSLYPVRLLMLAGILRVAVRGELRQIRWNSLDLVVVVAYLYVTAMFVVRDLMGFGTVDVAQVSLVDRMATFVDIIVAYFSLRALVRDTDDVTWLFSNLAFVLVPYVALLAIERRTGVNPFAAVGGLESIWRDGDRIRNRGSFMHSSLLGSFGASLVPIYIGMIVSRKRLLLSVVGLSCALAIVGFASSGGPLLFVVATVVAWATWFIKDYMRQVRYGILGFLIMLALVMKAPLWYIPDKLSIITGGDGWHRAYLMDQTIRHFDLWWLAGMPLQLAKSWFPYLANGGLDITNLFVAFALDAGLIGMGLLIAVFTVGFSRIGYRLKLLQVSADESMGDSRVIWALGALLAGHLANFFAITYFDQMYVMWVLVLATIASVTSADGSVAVTEYSGRIRARKVSRPMVSPRGRAAPSRHVPPQEGRQGKKTTRKRPRKA